MAQKPLKALIVDDEPLGRERIRTLLADRNDVVVAGEASDGAEALGLLDDGSIDLVFLDIQMPGKSGFALIDEVGPGRMPPIVFVTAYDEYALKAFEVHALDYLLKPFEPERFHEAVDRALAAAAQPAAGDAAARIERLLEGMRGASKPLTRLMVKTQDHIEFVDVDDIDWIESAGNYANLHVGKRSLLIRQTMKALEQRLDDEHFMRIHRSSIVNVNRIREVYSMFNGDYEVRLTDGTRLTLSRGYRKALDRFA